ncbi:hypothetical protein L2E82_27159 [Cichorium intybus]|uniref:Uncharacterized protein n=1 Tax=Cichorium intybus TaxID=13427 RepID=A0ACB9CS76_CICIN|nr:hypothetical protein L2E82_27159 [Cichorium intybus]
MWIEDYQNRRMTQAELNDFHSVDRELYATLVYDLWRDPIEAIQMMAIWIWLERVSMVFPDLTRRILTLPFHLIDKLGDEALLCWSCIDNVRLLFSASVNDFPLTTILLKKEMPLDFLRKFREFSITGINEVITIVCANCFKDIWDGAIARNAHVDFLQCMASSLEPVTPAKTMKIQPDDRTLFVTFSRGYPVAEWEVREFFYGLFGECIESFYMQEVAAGEHALFAKIVLNHLSYIHAVLSGGTKAKFTINGKHVWMRKFIPRDQRG